MADAGERACRIVFYGPLGAGKTTCLQSFRHLVAEARGKPRAFEAQNARTTKVDFLAPDLSVAGTRTRIFLSTVSGWAYPDADRRLLVKDADGIVFIADSRREGSAANLASMTELLENLRANDRALERVPLVLFYNKRDLPEIAAVDELNAALNTKGLLVTPRPWFEGSATQRRGISEALRAVARLAEREAQSAPRTSGVSGAEPLTARLALASPEPIVWEATGDPSVPFRALSAGKRLYVAQGEPPAEPLYTLVVDGEKSETHEEWPDHWILPRMRIGGAAPAAARAPKPAAAPKPPPITAPRAPTAPPARQEEPPDDAAGFARFVAAKTDARAWTELARAYRGRLRRLPDLTPEQRGHRPEVDVQYDLWRALGLVYRDRLADKASALEALGMALRWRPSADDDRLALAELYEELGRSDEALTAYEALIALHPTRVDLYRRLHRFYAREGRLDEARCVAAVVLGIATEAGYDDERAFCARHVPITKHDEEPALDARGWALLRHRGESEHVRAILAVVAPVAARLRRAATAARGERPPPDRRFDHPATNDPRFADAQAHAAVVFGVPAPAPLATAKAVVEPGALAYSFPQLLFVAGKHAVYMQPEHQLGGHDELEELTLVFRAAVAVATGESPRAANELVPRITELVASLRASLRAEEMAALRTAVNGWYDADGGKAYLRVWLDAVERTSLRAGLLLAGDFTLARLSSTIGRGPHLMDLAEFAASRRYFALRKQLGQSTTMTLASAEGPVADASGARSAERAEEFGGSGGVAPDREAGLLTPPSVRARDRLFGLYGTVQFKCGMPAGIVLIAAVVDAPTPILIGWGLAYNRFNLCFTREAFGAPEQGPQVPIPDIYLVISIRNAAEDDFLVAHRHDIKASRVAMLRGDLGTIVLPLKKGDRPSPPAGLVGIPGIGEARRRLRLDDEVLSLSTQVAETALAELTGWTNLATGVRIAVVDDFVDAIRRRVEALLERTSFDAREAAIIEHAGRALQAFGLWDPTQQTVYLNRRELEQQSLGFLHVTLAHELVHVGQTKHHPELAALVRQECAKAWTRALAGEPATRETNERLFGLMANLEGYADFVERGTLALIFTCSMQLAREDLKVPDLALPSRSHNELDVLEEPSAPPSLRTILISQKSAQYDSGRRAYVKRQRVGELTRFDPDLRPEPILPEELLKPLMRRAVGGCTYSQMSLGDIYRTGGMVGVVADRAKALRWYRLAAAGGSAEATARLRELEIGSPIVAV